MEKITCRRAFFVFPKYDGGDEIKQDKVGGTYKSYGERKNV